MRAVMDKDARVAQFESGDWIQLDYHHDEGPLKGLTLGSALAPDRCPPLAELTEGRRVIITYEGDYKGPGSKLLRVELDESPETLTPEERIVYLAYLLGEVYEHMEEKHGLDFVETRVGHSLVNLLPRVLDAYEAGKDGQLWKAFGSTPTADEIVEVERVLRKVKAWE